MNPATKRPSSARARAEGQGWPVTPGADTIVSDLIGEEIRWLNQQALRAEQARTRATRHRSAPKPPKQ